MSFLTSEGSPTSPSKFPYPRKNTKLAKFWNPQNFHRSPDRGQKMSQSPAKIPRLTRPVCGLGQAHGSLTEQGEVRRALRRTRPKPHTGLVSPGILVRLWFIFGRESETWRNSAKSPEKPSKILKTHIFEKWMEIWPLFLSSNDFGPVKIITR